MSSSKTEKRPNRNRPIIESLESRVLYSADPLGLSIDSSEFALVDDNVTEPVLRDPDPLSTKQIILVDENVKDHQTLIRQLSGTGIDGSDQSTTVVIISSDQSVTDISDLLSRYSGLNSIHFITHSSDDSVRIGASVLSSSTVDEFRDELSHWGDSLSTGGDILFYGCNLAESDNGKQLIDDISRLTGADVAASTDLTGHHRYGADWELEYAIGEVLADSQMFTDQLDDWESVLTTIVVDTVDDVVDATDMSSIAALTSTSGPEISLREAITAANNDPGADVIELPIGNFDLDAGELVVTDDLTITGKTGDSSDTIIDAGLQSRVFSFSSDSPDKSSVTLSNLTIQNGKVTNEDGGGIHALASDITLRNITLKDNNSTNDDGGAIFIGDTVSTISIFDSVLTRNSSGDEGGAIYNDGTATIIRTELSSNSGVDGGAIFNTGQLIVTDAWLYNNAADQSGGAIHNEGTAAVSRSLLDGNTADQRGGGITNDDNNAELVIKNTTLTNNSATNNSSSGGAVANRLGTTDISLSTIVHNQAQSFSAISDSANDTTIQSSIIYLNTTVDSGPDVEGSSDGYNLSDAYSSDFDKHTTDIGAPNVNPGLEINQGVFTLSDEGGFAEVYKLRQDSIAINRGPANLTGETDSTGAIRNAISDIGAYEYRHSANLGTVYIAEASTNSIIRLTTETGHHQVIVNNTGTITDIEADEVHNRIYWVESNNTSGSLFSANLDGSNIDGQPTEIATGLVNPQGLAIDNTQTPPKIFVTRDTTELLANNGIDIYNGFTGEKTATAIEGPAQGSGAIQMKRPGDVDFHSGSNTIFWTESGQGYVKGIHSLELTTYTHTQLVSLPGYAQPPTGLAVLPDASTIWYGTSDMVYVGPNNSQTGNAILASPGQGSDRLDYFAPTNTIWTTDASEDDLLIIPITGSEYDPLKNYNDPGAIAVAGMDTIQSGPVIVLNKSASVLYNNSIPLTKDEHLYTVDSNPAETVTYTLVTAPQKGQLRLDGVILNPSTNPSFTQTDINSGILRYYHTGSIQPDNDTFVFRASDGNTDTDDTPDTIFDITIRSNDAPSVTPPTGYLGFFYMEQEGGKPNPYPNLLFMQDDGPNLGSAVVAIDGYQQGDGQLSYTDRPLVTGAWDANTGEMTLSGVASIAEYKTAINSVLYENNSDNPDTNRIQAILITINDGQYDSNTIRLPIYMTAVNDQPLLNNLGNTTPNPTYAEDGPAIVIDNDATVIDPELTDNNNFGGATLTLQRNGAVEIEDIFQAADTGPLEAIIEGQPLTISDHNIGQVTTNSAGTLRLTFNSLATNELVNSVIQNIAYSNNNDLPPTEVEISWEFNDNNNGDQGDGGPKNVFGTTIINITSANDQPVIEQLGNTPQQNFTEDGHPVLIDTDTTISDPELSFIDNFNDTTLTIQRSGAANSDDSFRAHTTGPLGPLTELQPLTVDGTSIGQISKNSAGLLTLTFSGTVSNNQINDVIQHIAYSNGNDSPPESVELEWSFTDNNSNQAQGTDPRTTTGTITIGLTAVNDNPTNATGTLPTDIIVNEDIPGDIDLSPIHLTDPDAGTGNLTMTLTTATGGSLSATPDAGVTLIGNGSGLLSLTGNQSDLNNYLNLPASIQYISALNSNGDDADSIRVDVSDNGNSGIGAGSAINIGTINIDITAINDDPVNTGSLPTSITVTEDIAANADLSLINLSDADSASANLTITLTTTAGGTLTTATTSGGVTVAGRGSGVLALTGTQSNLNSLLNLPSSIQFTSALHANGNTADTIQVSVTDHGNSGNGGGGTISFGTVNVDINPINDDPANAGSLPTDITVTEDVASAIDLSLIDLTDVDSAAGGLTITLTTTNGGTLEASAANGITVSNSTTNALSLSGTQSDLNSFLNQPSVILFTSALNANGNNFDAIQVEVTDNGNTGTSGGGAIDFGTINIDINAINDDPVNAGSLPADIIVVEDIASDLDLSLIDLSDVDSSAGALTIKLTTSTGGRLVATTANGVTVTGSGSGSLFLSGHQNDLNNFLNLPSNVLFTSALNASGNNSDTVQIEVTDNGNSGTGGGSLIDFGTINIDITAINDDPVNNGGLPVDITVSEDIPGNLDLSLIDLSDTDSATDNLTITLTTSTGGTLAATPGNGITVTGSGTALLSLTGNQSDLNSLLNLPSAVLYTSAVNTNGTNADTVRVDVSDNGNTGAGGGGTISFGTINIDINPTNDDPVNAGSLPTDIITVEDIASAVDLSSINLLDVDSMSGNLTTTLSTNSGGTLMAVSGSGITVAGSGSDVLSLTGSQNDLNLFLNLPAAILYTGASNASGNDSDTIQLHVSDNGNSGGGGGNLIGFGTVNIDINAINDDPVNAGRLPTDISVSEDIASNLDLSLINLSDIDSAAANLTISLTTSAGGTLVSNSGSGITIAGSGTGLLSVTGNQNDINTFLNQPASVQFISPLNAYGNDFDTVRIDVTDNGHSGTGSGGTINLGAVNIDINPTNDDPVNLGSLPADIIAIEDIASAVDLSLIDLSDVDSASGNLTITLATSAGGTMVATPGGGISVSDSGSGTLSLTGSQSDLNQFLNLPSGILYTGASNASGNNSDTIRVDVDDNGNTGSGGGSINFGTVSIDINAINDDPVNTGSVPARIIVSEDLPGNVDLGQIEFSDVDSATGNLTITLATDSGGTLTAATGSIAVSGNGTNHITLTGTLASLNSYLNIASNIQYLSALNATGNGADTIEISISDNGNTGSGGGSTISAGSVAVDITAINDAPVNSIPAVQTIDEETQTPISGLSIEDVDVASSNITTRLQSENGVLNIALSGNAVVAAGVDGSNDLTIQGTVSDINSTLTSVLYTGNKDVTGSAADTLTITTNDNGNQGSGGAQQDTDTVQINITGVNDKPLQTDIELYSLSYIENDSPTPVTSTLTLNDVDDKTLQSAMIKIINNYQSEEDILGFNDFGNISGSWNNSDGTLTLSGSDTVANYQTALQSVTYHNSSDNPLETTRSLSFTVNDGDANASSVSRDITVSRVNDAPSGTDNTITLLEDLAHVFTVAEFGFSDSLDNHVLMAIEITSIPDRGALTLNDIPLVAGDRIDATDIDAGSLLYIPPANSHGIAFNSFDFRVLDNGGTNNTDSHRDPTANTITINVTPVNDAPAGTDTIVTTFKNTDLILSAGDFGFHDPLDTDSLLAITISTVPGNGLLSLNANTISAGQSVPLSAIENNELVFTPLTDATGEPYSALYFQVQDDGGTLNGGTDTDATANRLTINVIAERQPELGFALPVSVAVESSGPAVSETVEDRPEQIKDIAAKPEESSPIYPQPDRQQYVVPELPAPPEIPLITYVEMEIELNHYVTKASQTTTNSEAIFIDLDNAADIQQHREQLIVDTTMTRLANQMNNTTRPLADNTELDYQVAGTTTIASGLSVGYIFWLLRSGTLLASVLSSLPAWRSIDPLPILGSLDESSDNNDTETLESMVNESAEAENDQDITHAARKQAN